MYDIILKQLVDRKDPIDIIVVGLGFMGFGFISNIKNIPGMRVSLVISRRPKEALAFLKKNGLNARIEHNPSRIKDFADKGIICVSDRLELIGSYENEIVLEMTGTVPYGTEVSLAAINAKKHLVTMNPELQVTVGTELTLLAQKQGVIFTDVIGDQPGSLSRLISQAKLMGFTIRMAGNMKRFMNRHATQVDMKPWADDKGLAVRQTTSFTDGTKQSIEMNLVANYFGMTVLQFGMQGPQIETIKDALTAFKWDRLPEEGAVDYVLGKNLMPGVFVVVEHKDPNQKKYLRYLNMGEGPRYVLFDSYHLTHLEVPLTIASVVLYGKETINNGISPNTETIAVAKFDLAKGQRLDGIGGDTVYGNIDRIESAEDFLPVGLAEGAIVKHYIHQDQPIKITDVELPINAATMLKGLVAPEVEKIWVATSL